jgi:signal transduction histidine kinase
VALTEQLTALAAADGAQFTLVGTERPLPADAGLAIYRAAQEALSNARKHAPGADVALQLALRCDGRRPRRDQRT